MAFSHTNSKGTTYYLNSKDVTLKSKGILHQFVEPFVT